MYFFSHCPWLLGGAGCDCPITSLHSIKFLLTLLASVATAEHCCLLVPALGEGSSLWSPYHKRTQLTGRGHAWNWDSGNRIDLKGRYFSACLSPHVWSVEILSPHLTTLTKAAPRPPFYLVTKMHTRSSGYQDSNLSFLSTRIRAYKKPWPQRLGCIWQWGPFSPCGCSTLCGD